MKTIKFLSYSLFILFLIISISSCSGDDGDDGADGATGADGADGINGQDGNANVKVGTLDLTNSDWLWRGNYTFSPNPGSNTSYFTRYVDIDVPEITESIHTTGLVLVYYKPYENANDWDSLPFFFTSFGGGYITNIVFRSEIGKIKLHYFWTTNGGTVPTGLQTHIIANSKVKYIVIEGEAIGATTRTKQSNKIINKLKNAGIDTNDYYAVCEYYGINPE